MASSAMPGRSLRVPDNLNVTGRGLSPQPSPALHSPEDANMLSVPSSSRTSMSDDESEKSEEYTVLDGVREMNQILVRQIETLRLKIKVDEKNHDNDKARLVESKDSEIQAREQEIEDMKESVVIRDDKIRQLTKASQEKDRTIKSKCDEIEELKQMVRQTKDYAQKIQKQVGRVRHQKDKLESDTLYKQQNEEIRRLTDELELLRSRLATMEQELARAMKVIEQQNEKLKNFDSDRTALQAKFREDLDKASKAMRQEVERMREVMRQNYEEMRNLREQNLEMHSDVRAIKEMLRANRGGGGASGPSPTHHQEVVTGLQRPMTSGNGLPSYGRQTHGQTNAVAPQGPGKMTGGNILKSASSRRPPQVLQGTHLQTQPHQHSEPTVHESHQFVSRNGRGSFRNTQPLRLSSQTDSSGQTSAMTTSRLSPDTSARTIAPGQTPRTDISKGVAGQHLNVPTTNDAKSSKNLPSICSIKEGVAPSARQPSGRGARAPVVRKGSAIKKR